MSNTITAARQVIFDKELVKKIKRLESLASPGSYATFRGEQESLTVTFHNGKNCEIETRRKLDVPCGGAFDFTIKGKSIMDILKAFDEVTVTIREKTLSFQSGHAKMNRNIEKDAPKSSFPDFSKAELSPLPRTTFRDAAFASYATAQGGEFDAAERVSVLLKDDTVSIVATNSLMAVCVVSPANYKGGETEYMLHPRFIEPLAPLTMKEEAPNVLIGKTDNRYLVKFGDYEITSRIPASPSVRGSIEGSLERIASVPTMSLNLSAAPLKMFFERAKLLDEGATQVSPVVFLVKPDENVVIAKHVSPLGDIQDLFEADVSGTPMPNMPIGFSLKYITDVFAHLRSNDAQMAIRGQRSMITLTEEVDETVITHILLPVVPRTGTDDMQAKKEDVLPAKPDNSTVSSSDFED